MKKNLIMLVLVTIAVMLGLKLEFSAADDCYVDESNSCEGLFGELSRSYAEQYSFEVYSNADECGTDESGRDESLFPRARLAFQNEDGYEGWASTKNTNRSTAGRHTFVDATVLIFIGTTRMKTMIGF